MAQLETTVDRYVDADRILDLSMQFWETAAADERLGSRLAGAGTVVHVHFTDVGDGQGFTLFLDRNPIEVVGGFVGDAEVNIYGTAAAWLKLVRQDKRLAIAIAKGEMDYTGPVRKFLRIVPILQNFEFSMWEGVRYDRRERAEGAPPEGERRDH